MRSVSIALLALAGLMLCSCNTRGQKGGDFSQFEQLLPRGRIAAINTPVFVPAAEANIADDSWVLGVFVDGKARAYSLSLLNSHEVVNDRIGDHRFAAVW